MADFLTSPEVKEFYDKIARDVADYCFEEDDASFLCEWSGWNIDPKTRIYHGSWFHEKADGTGFWVTRCEVSQAEIQNSKESREAEHHVRTTGLIHLLEKLTEEGIYSGGWVYSR